MTTCGHYLRPRLIISDACFVILFEHLENMIQRFVLNQLIDRDSTITCPLTRL